MKLAVSIALRYLFTFRNFHFITFITIISIIGIVIGVAALIIVMSIFNGFGEFTEKQLISYDPHIRILPKQGVWLEDYQSAENKLKNIREISGYSPVLSGRILVAKESNIKVVQLFGYPPNQFKRVSGIGSNIISGKLNLKSELGYPRVILGANLAYMLKVTTKDAISLMSMNTLESSILTMSEQVGQQAKVAAIFLTNNTEYDDTYCITSIEAASGLLNPPQGAVSAIDIRLNSVDESEKVQEQLRAMLPGFNILTWYDLHKELYNILKFERIAVFVVLSLIIIIAVFNVLASLAMTVTEKRPDIGVLKALGADDKLIRRIYILLGSIIGAISTLIGTLIGLGFCYGQINFGWIKLNDAQFLVPTLPLSVHASDIVIVICVSMLLSIAATIYPSRKAAKTGIIEAIREE
jgi:lipoprotein-releasing system permease protein